MADKQITELPASSGVTNETQFPVYQPGSLSPAQKVSGAQIAAFAEAAGEAAASDLQRGATFTPDYDPSTGTLSWTNDRNLPNPEPEVVGGVSSFKGRTGAVVPKSGDYTPDMVGAATRPNLLDNWCFLPGHVVNQRGETSYSAARYSVDRWIASTNCAASISSAGVAMAKASTSIASSANLYQRATLTQILGKIVTISALVDGVLLSATGQVPIEIAATGVVLSSTRSDGAWVQIYARVTEAVSFEFGVPYNGTTSVTVTAVKLELGDTQTLAHQDAEGNWVLNEYPDYNEQLMRCCMSTADPTDTYANNKRTPAAIGAVKKSGDTMTGNLAIQKSSPLVFLRNTAASRMGIVNNNNSGHTALQNFDLTKYLADTQVFDGRYFRIRSGNAVSNDALQLGCFVDGVESTYNIFHTGNKPTGTYTGNGSATSRTINMGGLGSAIVITSTKANCIVLANGAFHWSGAATGAVASGVCKFVSGVLTLATAAEQFNANGITYTYQVL